MMFRRLLNPGFYLIAIGNPFASSVGLRCPLATRKKLLTFLIFFGLLVRRLKERPIWRSPKKLPQDKRRLLLLLRRNFASNKMALNGVDEAQ